MLKPTTLLYFHILVNILKSAKGTAYVYARGTSDGFVDFRSMGIGQPNELLGVRRQLKQFCCKGYMPAGSRMRQGALFTLKPANITNVDFSYNKIKIVNDTSFVGWNSVSMLRLDYNEITEISANAFSGLCLTLLSLKGNKLSFVKLDNWCKLSSISYIDLSFNYLNSIYALSLPTVLTFNLSHNLFTNMSNIRIYYSDDLHLENNKITKFAMAQNLDGKGRSKLFMDNNLIEVLEGHVSELHLQGLSISHNLIHKISHDFFGDAFSLIFINLSHNYLTVLANGMFSNLNNLEKLDLSGNKITQINVDSMRRMLGLRQILMSANPISIVPLNFLWDCPRLQRIELCGAIESPIFFDRFPNLENLRLFGADMETLRKISKFTMYLNHFELSNVATSDTAGLMNTCNISNLNRLVLNFLKLQTIPVSMMRTSRNLKYLSLANNNLVSVDLAAFPATLVEANLSNNFIEELLSFPINNLPGLRIIDLQNNSLKSVPLYFSQDGTQLDFTNLVNNNILNVSEQVIMQSINTRYLCFNDNCVNTDIKLAYYGLSNLPNENILGCQCHSSIRDLNGFSKIRVYIDGQNFHSDLFKNYILGCIKHASIYNGSDVRDLHIFSSLASDLSSLHLYGWNLSQAEKFHLGCSPQLQQLSIIKSGLKYINQSVLSSFSHLLMLDLSENKLTEFQFGFLQYTPKVEDLNLSHNLIAKIEIPRDIPFKNILQLKNLDLSNNKLTAVEFGRFYILANLDKLYLSYNEIISVLSCSPSDSRQVVCRNFPLRALSLASNYVTEWTLRRNWNLKNLVELDLSENGMSRFEGEDFDSICFLNLSRNCISQLTQKGCLRGGFILDITRNEIVHLSRIQLKYSPAILNASWNFIVNIKRTDMEDKSTLSKLYLSNNLISKLDAGCFSRMIFLKTLDLSYNRITNFQARNLFARANIGYHWNQHILDEINLSGNLELNMVSLAVNSSAIQKQKLSISKLCTIETHNCLLSGEDVKRYLQLPENQRNNIIRSRQIIDVDSPYFSCSSEGTPVILLTCFGHK